MEVLEKRYLRKQGNAVNEPDKHVISRNNAKYSISAEMYHSIVYMSEEIAKDMPTLIMKGMMDYGRRRKKGRR